MTQINIKMLRIFLIISIFGAISFGIKANELENVIYLNDPSVFHVDINVSTDLKHYKVQELGDTLTADEVIQMFTEYYLKYQNDEHKPNIILNYHHKRFDEEFEPKLFQLAKKHGFFVLSEAETNSIPMTYIDKPLAQRLQEIWSDRQR